MNNSWTALLLGQWIILRILIFYVVVTDWFKIHFFEPLMLFFIESRSIKIIPANKIVVDLLLSRCIKLRKGIPILIIRYCLVNHVEVCWCLNLWQVALNIFSRYISFTNDHVWVVTCSQRISGVLLNSLIKLFRSLLNSLCSMRFQPWLLRQI